MASNTIGIDKSIKLWVTLLLLLLAIPLFLSGQSKENITIMHTPHKLSSLPEPGLNLDLTFYLKGTRRLDIPLTILLTIDGELIPIIINKARFTESELPTYTAKIPSPLVEIKYKAILRLDDTKKWQTTDYEVKRKCLPDIKRVTGFVDNSVTGSSRLAALEIQSSSLSTELNSYSRALELIREIKELTKKIKKEVK